MTEEELRDLILETLVRIAPEIDPEGLDPDKSFREQYDFDSIDFLNLMMALEKSLNVKIPPLDYPVLSSLSGAVSWLKTSVE